MVSKIYNSNNNFIIDENSIIKMQPNSSSIKNIINILENFIRSKKLLCHGGIAINNLLPDCDKIYKIQDKGILIN